MSNTTNLQERTQSSASATEGPDFPACGGGKNLVSPQARFGTPDLVAPEAVRVARSRQNRRQWAGLVHSGNRLAMSSSDAIGVQ